MLPNVLQRFFAAIGVPCHLAQDGLSLRKFSGDEILALPSHHGYDCILNVVQRALLIILGVERLLPRCLWQLLAW